MQDKRLIVARIIKKQRFLFSRSAEIVIILRIILQFMTVSDNVRTKKAPGLGTVLKEGKNHERID
ncbi:hypothetical protein HCH52_08355 [Oscillospiraceae bacterium HV4-5-C5C]|nr:hypothetical protein [Oscillospiraceae bacterium HV4-5-C5C]